MDVVGLDEVQEDACATIEEGGGSFFCVFNGGGFLAAIWMEQKHVFQAGPR